MLFQRLSRSDKHQKRVPIHQFGAILNEYWRGELGRADITSAFRLLGSGELVDLLDTLDSLPDARKPEFVLMVTDLLMLSETGARAFTKPMFFARVRAFR